MDRYYGHSSQPQINQCEKVWGNVEKTNECSRLCGNIWASSCLRSSAVFSTSTLRVFNIFVSLKQWYPFVTFHILKWGSRGLMLESRSCNRKVVSSSLGPAGIVGGGGWMSSALSTLNTTTEVPLSKTPNPQLLPGRHCSGCVFTVCVCVCAHFGWVKCRAQIQSMGHHTWWSRHLIDTSCN